MCLKIQSVHQHWMSNPVITARDLHWLLGMVVFMATLVHHGRLRLRPIQWWVDTAWWQRTGNWTDKITIPQWVLQEVACWASPAVLQGLPLAIQETEVTLCTDASNSGSGAQLGSRLIQGQWSASLRSSHKHKQAVINAVRASCLIWGPEWFTWCATMQSQLHTSRTRGALDPTLSCSWRYAWSGVIARPSGWCQSIYQECATSRPAADRLCYLRQRTSSLSYHIRTPGQIGRMQCPLPGTTGGASCMCSYLSSWSPRCCSRSTSLTEYKWYW